MIRKLVWAWVLVQVAKGIRREWLMTPTERVDRLLKRYYIDSISKQLNQRSIFFERYEKHV